MADKTLDSMSIDELIKAAEKYQHKIDEIIERISEKQTELNNSIVPSDETIEKAKALGPMDDIFFAKLAEDPGVCEEIISTCLGIPVSVLSVIPQSTIASIQNRGVRLDALVDVLPVAIVKVELMEDCDIGEKGARIDIEVQRSDDDDHQKRALYNAGAIMHRYTPKGLKKFKDVPDVVIIFISEFDMFKQGKMLYRVKRMIKVADKYIEVHNGMSEYYINTAIKDTSTPYLEKISELMEVFSDPDKYDNVNFPKLSGRKSQFKNTEEGVWSMSLELQEYIQEYAEKYADERAEERAKEIRIKDYCQAVNDGEMSLKYAASKVGKTIDELVVEMDKLGYAAPLEYTNSNS